MRGTKLVILAVCAVATAACDTQRITTPAGPGPEAPRNLDTVVPVTREAVARSISADLHSALAEARAVVVAIEMDPGLLKLHPVQPAEIVRTEAQVDAAARQLEASGLMTDEHRALLKELREQVKIVTAVLRRG